jgi:hypothetical protein
MRKMLSASCGPALPLVIWLGAVLSASSAANAADQPPTVPSEALFIAQIVLLLLLGRLLGELMQRIGQPAVLSSIRIGRGVNFVIIQSIVHVPQNSFVITPPPQ